MNPLKHMMFADFEIEQLKTQPPFLENEQEPLMKFYETHPLYKNQKELIEKLLDDLRDFWKNVENLRIILKLKTHEEVFLCRERQSVLVYLSTTPPWEFNVENIVKKWFDESAFMEMDVLISDLFQLWENMEIIKYQRWNDVADEFEAMKLNSKL